MEVDSHIKPLSYKQRQRTFMLLIFVFLASLPFLYLYATGDRFDMNRPTNLIATGGIYIAADRVGAEIYVDNTLVRETRTFRKAFYAQGLDAGTHRVHVQKEGHHTWVKELPVYRHLVTEAEAFNLPLVPQVRVIAPFQSATGTMIVAAPIDYASSTNELLATTTKRNNTFISNKEFETLIVNFSTTSGSISKKDTGEIIKNLLDNTATTTKSEEDATTTIVSNGAKLFTRGDDLFASWIGPQEEMPYYYCAPTFPKYSTTTEIVPPPPTLDTVTSDKPSAESIINEPLLQPVPKEMLCDPTIRIDRKWQSIHDFNFMPGSVDFVIVVLDHGIYVVEVDDRSWQNVQPLFIGDNLHMYIENNNIFVYDGKLIYQVLLKTE